MPSFTIGHHSFGTQDIIPFAKGETRPKQIISLGLFRTGSQSLAEALTILGYRDVYHSAAIVDDWEKFVGLGRAADDNIPCIPSYTGRTWTRQDWDRLFGPCEALTDVPVFAESLLEAYPEARVILVKRDFEPWARSFVDTLARPSSDGPLAFLSWCFMEALIGLHITQSARKMFMGMIGVCDMEKTKDLRILRAAYDRHHKQVRRLVPPENFLEVDLKDLDWEVLCHFLGKKEIPKQPFPRLNESNVFKQNYIRLHRSAVLAGSVLLCLSGILMSWFAYGVICVWDNVRMNQKS